MQEKPIWNYHPYTRKAHLNYLKYVLLNAVACLLCMLISPPTPITDVLFSCWIMWKIALENLCFGSWESITGLKHIVWELDTWVLAYITQLSSTIHDLFFSYCCYRYMYEHTYMRTYIYTLVNSFSIACVSMCPELTTWDWRTSVEGYPWRKSSPSLSSNWLLNPGSSTSDLPLNQYGNSNSSRDRNMWNFPCPGCHVNWCH